MTELSYTTVRSDRTEAALANVFNFGVRAEERMFAREQLKQLSATFEKFRTSSTHSLLQDLSG